MRIRRVGATPRRFANCNALLPVALPHPHSALFPTIKMANRESSMSLRHGKGTIVAVCALALGLGLTRLWVRTPAALQYWSASMTDEQGQAHSLPTGYALASGRLHIPVIGDTLEFLYSTFDFLDDRVKAYGNVSWAYPLMRHTAILSGPEGMATFYNRALVSTDTPSRMSTGSLLTAPPTPTPATPPPPVQITREHTPSPMLNAVAAGHMLSMADDERFRERRARVVAAVKDHAAIDAYLPAVEDVVLSYLRRWQASPSAFKLVPEVHKMCCEIATRIFIGVNDGGAAAGAIMPLSEAVMKGTQALPIPLPGMYVCCTRLCLFSGCASHKGNHCYHVQELHTGAVRRQHVSSKATTVTSLRLI